MCHVGNLLGPIPGEGNSIRFETSSFVSVDRYVDMFKEEGGKDALERVLKTNANNVYYSNPVRQLIDDVCKDILDILS